MYYYSVLLQYWSDGGLPLLDLLRANHTVFSEESGEIALSVLVHAQPQSEKADLLQTQRFWAMVRQRYESLHRGDPAVDVLKRDKKYRLKFLFPHA